MSYTNGLDKPSDYFNTKLYTGTGATQSISSVGFQPDWVWIKERNSAVSHHLYDSVRGATKRLESDNTDAETTAGTFLTSFDSDGFTLGSNGGLNGSSDTYASWNWLASNTTASNTDGSITSTVSANTTSGFSIVSYTGTGANATVGHGLGSVPKMIIIKNRDVVRTWVVYHHSIGNTKGLFLDTTAGETTDSTFFNNTTPTSSVFSIGAQGDTNRSSENLIAYCFAEKKGFSKFGSYTGNGSTDGTFVYTGFKPAFIILKNASNSQNWYMYDNKRTPNNFANYHFYADLPNAEAGGSTFGIDILSNGWKIRTSNDGWNGSGENYIFMAFAENPFTTSTGIPTTAR